MVAIINCCIYPRAPSRDDRFGWEWDTGSRGFEEFFARRSLDKVSSFLTQGDPLEKNLSLSLLQLYVNRVQGSDVYYHFLSTRTAFPAFTINDAASVTNSKTSPYLIPSGHNRNTHFSKSTNCGVINGF